MDCEQIGRAQLKPPANPSIFSRPGPTVPVTFGRSLPFGVLWTAAMPLNWLKPLVQHVGGGLWVLELQSWGLWLEGSILHTPNGLELEHRFPSFSCRCGVKGQELEQAEMDLRQLREREVANFLWFVCSFCVSIMWAGPMFEIFSFVKTERNLCCLCRSQLSDLTPVQESTIFLPFSAAGPWRRRREKSCCSVRPLRRTRVAKSGCGAAWWRQNSRTSFRTSGWDMLCGLSRHYALKRTGHSYIYIYPISSLTLAEQLKHGD